MKLRVGIVGLGSQWEARYLPALRALADRFEVRGICEQVAHRAARAAAELNATPVDGFRALAFQFLLVTAGSVERHEARRQVDEGDAVLADHLQGRRRAEADRLHPLPWHVVAATDLGQWSVAGPAGSKGREMAE